MNIRDRAMLIDELRSIIANLVKRSDSLVERIVTDEASGKSIATNTATCGMSIGMHLAVSMVQKRLWQLIEEQSDDASQAARGGVAPSATDAAATGEQP
jgi:hypothetical protein